MKKPQKDKARSGKNGGFMGKSDLLLTGFKPQKRATATPAEVLLRATGGQFYVQQATKKLTQTWPEQAIWKLL